MTQEVAELNLSSTPPLVVDKVLDSRVYKKTRKKDYLDHLIKWVGKNDVDPTWVKDISSRSWELILT